MQLIIQAQSARRERLRKDISPKGKIRTPESNKIIRKVCLFALQILKIAVPFS